MSERDDTRDDVPGAAEEAKSRSERPDEASADAETRTLSSDAEPVGSDGEPSQAEASASEGEPTSSEPSQAEASASEGEPTSGETSAGEGDSSEGAPDEEPVESVDADDIKSLLRGALVDTDEPVPDARLLRGVQKRLRERSGGKFYADGWSTSKHPPVGTYFVTSFIMLLVLFAVYAALTSLVGEAVDVDNTPAPVRIVFPKQAPR